MAARIVIALFTKLLYWLKLGVQTLQRFRLRIFFRCVFLLLALATVALAGFVLQQEKQLSYNNYQTSFNKTRQQISATLRHPAGHLALLNPPAGNKTAALHPLLLPYAALDFDDQVKVQQAIAMADCLVQYGSAASLCVGIGNNPWAGGFIYLAGNFNSTNLVAHQRGDLTLHSAHRMKVSVALRGQKYEWLAPFEAEPSKKNQGLRGRLTGFLASEAALDNARPVKDFRGWIWQKALCHDARETSEDCPKNAFFSLRLPIGVLQDALFEKTRPVWPPADLAQIHVELQVLPPNSDIPIFDSRQAPSSAPFSLSDLQPMLLPGEVLQIKKLPQRKEIVQLTGTSAEEEGSWLLLTELIRRLPVDEYDTPLAANEIINTPLESYEITLRGDVRSVSKTLSVVATRMVWFVVAMLLALIFAWLLIEISLIRRISKLTRRAVALSKTVKGAGGVEQFDISDLRSMDEMGLLASCLHDLLRRVKEDVEREAIRAEQDRQMWHAVGHEIMSPLQSLMVLHAEENDPSQRYIYRMQQAIRVLYGSASPSEAFQSTVLQVSEIDLLAFLHNVAGNAHFIGISQVEFVHTNVNAVMVRADEYSLEDVVTHVLRNAERFRTPGTAITLNLSYSELAATLSIHNCGPQIAPDMLEKIFEYGVSDQHDAGANGNRGQGLFVAKTYMAKMGGTIYAQNVADGVVFVLGLQRGVS